MQTRCRTSSWRGIAGRRLGHICDFDHVIADIHLPIKDQGIVKTPVRIGPDCWIGVRLRAARYPGRPGLRARRARGGARDRPGLLDRGRLAGPGGA